MDKIEEVKKLKQLLDDKIIDEEDFKAKKAQILGIQTEGLEEREINTKSKSLDDYEKELLKQSNKIIETESLENKLEDEYYKQEKIKAKARLEAEEEIRSKKRKEQKDFVNQGINKTKRIIKWILTIFLLIFGIASIGVTKENGVMYIPLGILTLVLGGLACPKITDKTQKYQGYTKYKTAIIWIIIILWIVLCMIAGTEHV